MHGQPAAADVRIGLGDRQAQALARHALGVGGLALAPELRAARRALEPDPAVERRVVLERDQDLRDVPLGVRAHRDLAVGQRGGDGWHRGHRRSRTVPCPAVEASGISYQVRRSERARRVRVTVDPSRGVEVVLPRRAPDRAAAAAVVELRPWIERRLREVERARAAVAARGSTVPYLGQTLTTIAERGRTRVHRRGETLLVPDGTATRDAALERWYRRAAAAEISAPSRSGLRGLRQLVYKARHPRPAHALGELLAVGHDELQLAAVARP